MLDNTIRYQFEGAKVLVTGGTGMIGRQVVKVLCESGAKVKIVSLDRCNIDKDLHYTFYPLEYIYGDLSNLSLCKKVTKDMDFVFHLEG